VRFELIKDCPSSLRLVFYGDPVVRGVGKADDVVALGTRQCPVEPPTLAVKGVIVDFNQVLYVELPSNFRLLNLPENCPKRSVNVAVSRREFIFMIITRWT